jgi:bifunctional non-homologous end joining protein LigD
VVLGADGTSDFNALHSGKQGSEVQLCAFDVLAIDGDDLRELPLTKRKVRLERLLKGPSRRHLHQPFKVGMGLEGLVSKRSDRPYRGGQSVGWIKVKNRQHHAFGRVAESFR